MALKQSIPLLAVLHTYFQMRNCFKDKSTLLITEYRMQIKKDMQCVKCIRNS